MLVCAVPRVQQRVRSFTSFLRFSSLSSNPPQEPIDFGLNFKLPQTPIQMELELLNSHPYDSNIVFQEQGHNYYYNEALMKYSVTEVVEHFFEKFDPDSAIEKMMTGNNWPRTEYQDTNGNPMTPSQIKFKWDRIGEYARNRGSWMHYNIERYLNNLVNRMLNIEHVLFL